MNDRYFRLGAILFMLTGLIHIAVHLGAISFAKTIPPIFENMMNTTIAEGKSVYDFYIGFSVVMGLMLFAFGWQTWNFAKANTLIFKLKIETTLISLIAFGLTICYFPLVPIVFVGTASFLFVWSSIRVIQLTKS
ncbi:MAG: hypothetical protein GY810_25655 [Aureispira sp.]|nr:hypothetical protein [Aureispira sp.]